MKMKTAPHWTCLMVKIQWEIVIILLDTYYVFGLRIILTILDWALVSSITSSWGAKNYTLEIITKNSGMDENRQNFFISCKLWISFYINIINDPEENLNFFINTNHLYCLLSRNKVIDDLQ